MDVGASMYPAPFHVVPYGVEIANRVFVGGCPYNMTELELTQFFSKFGDVKDAKIITDRDGGKSRGYGFVTFATEEQAANVYSKGSIYYEQKKLNVAKAIRKHGGQYQKANQGIHHEYNSQYMNGQQHMVWLHPNGYLMTQQDSGWASEQLPSHSQPVKPYYSLLPPPPPSNPAAGIYGYGPHPYMQAPPLGHTPMYGGNFYGQPYYEDPAVSIITATDGSNHTSQEYPSHFSTPPSADHEYSSHLATPPSAGHEGDAYLDMEALEAKTKQLSMDSAYTSEVDLDSSHNTNSGTASPKDLFSTGSPENSAPSSPKQRNKNKDTQSDHTSKQEVQIITPPPAGKGVAN